LDLRIDENTHEMLQAIELKYDVEFSYLRMHVHAPKLPNSVGCTMPTRREKKSSERERGWRKDLELEVRNGQEGRGWRYKRGRRGGERMGEVRGEEMGALHISYETFTKLVDTNFFIGYTGTTGVSDKEANNTTVVVIKYSVSRTLKSVWQPSKRHELQQSKQNNMKDRNKYK